MSGQSDQLRQKAAALFDAQHRQGNGGRRDRERGLQERTIGSDIPNGPGTVLRATWRSINGGPEDFSVRGWMQDPFGDVVPMSGFGLYIRPSMLPALAAVIAEALDQLEVTDRGLRVRAPACDDDERSPGGARLSALPTGRRTP